MSYDTWVEIDTGGEYPARVEDSINMTSNVSPMWRVALGFPFRDIDGMNCTKAILHLERAIAYFNDPAHSEELKAMNPANGWGNTESALKYLTEILVMCQRHPLAKIGMSY